MKKINGILTDVTEEDIKLLKENLQEFWKDVTSIGSHAFYICLSLTSITIPNSVTKIGECAFCSCKSLKSITIPNSVTSIGSFAFCLCLNLTSITIPNSVTKIGGFAFGGCSSLTSVTIPESVTEIEKGAFNECSSLTNVEIPESVTRIGAEAFRKCSNLVNVIIPNSVTKIESGAFAQCSSLTSITIPESVTRIGYETFAYCSSLTSITIPDSVIYIGLSAFYGCSNLENVVIPDSVIEIADYAFEGVKSVIINGKRISGEFVNNTTLKLIRNNPNINLKQLEKLYQKAKEKGLGVVGREEFINFCYSLGLCEDKSKMVQVNKNSVPVCDVAFTFMQGVLDHDDLDLEYLHRDMQGFHLNEYNEAYAKFVMNKNNWADLQNHLDLLPRIYDWFKERTEMDFSQNTNSLLPTTEENRFKLLVYEQTENGIDRMHWRVPTVEGFIKEFENQKFYGIKTAREREIAEELAPHRIYEQKHFVKALEIDKEREASGVKDILSKPVRQNRIASLDEYRQKTKKLRNQILSDASEILSDQIEDTSEVFTYEVLSKSDPANFVMGCMTSCCATLYGAGAGAMRAMIIHPDIQPLVIRDFDNNIISFGVIYVNRDEGYAVVNDFEVNRKYAGKTEIRKAIYKKAMQGVKAFVKEYNAEFSEKPIRRVTCGCSPNWIGINDFIRSNPESKILKAPDFDDFKYAGSGSWSGDWHREQYEIWNMEKEREK